MTEILHICRTRIPAHTCRTRKMTILCRIQSIVDNQGVLNSLSAGQKLENFFSILHFEMARFGRFGDITQGVLWWMTNYCHGDPAFGVAQQPVSTHEHERARFQERVDIVNQCPQVCEITRH